jgi:Flp pilus assembly protein TadB
MTQTRMALLIGAIPIIIALIYFGTQQRFGQFANVDPGGALLLACLGVSMGFGFLVILRGARDL